MKILAALLALLYYAVIVFSSGVLLAGAQLRSSTGAALDTWRLNYESNRALNETLTQNLKTANTKLRNDLDIQARNESCARFFDKQGVIKKNMIDSETAKSVADAKQNHTDINKLSGDTYCVVKGYSMLKLDIMFKGCPCECCEG